MVPTYWCMFSHVQYSGVSYTHSHCLTKKTIFAWRYTEKRTNRQTDQKWEIDVWRTVLASEINNLTVHQALVRHYLPFAGKSIIQINDFISILFCSGPSQLKRRLTSYNYCFLLSSSKSWYISPHCKQILWSDEILSIFV